MADICITCKIVNNPDILEASRKIAPEHRYYLSCRQGHILCGSCKNKYDKLDECRVGASHPVFKQKVECLKHRKGEMILQRVKSERFRQEKEVKGKMEELGVLKEWVNQGRPGQQPEQRVIYRYQNQIDKLYADLDRLIRQVRMYENNQRYFLLFFDVLASAISFLSAIFITIAVSLRIRTFDYQFIAPYLFVEYYVALALFLFPFYVAVILEAKDRFQHQQWSMDSFFRFLRLIIVFVFIFIAVPISIPINTLMIIKGKPSEWVYLFPGRAPLGWKVFSWKIDYSLSFLKSIVFWIILIVRKSAFQNTFELFTLVWSFVEAICIVYLTIRHNQNQPHVKSLYQE